MIILPDTHDLKRIFKENILAVMDLKEHILNEVRYYGSTRSFTSLRETLYQTKANMPIGFYDSGRCTYIVENEYYCNFKKEKKFALNTNAIVKLSKAQ